MIAHLTVHAIWVLCFLFLQALSMDNFTMIYVINKNLPLKEL